MRHFLTFIAPLLCAAVAGVGALNADEWQKQTIYQLMTDRFARPKSHGGGTPKIGAPDVEADCPNPRQYCGGTWRGIIERLDYIQGMGFTAVWISPVVENGENSRNYYSYHGYWPVNLYAPNHHFGTEEDLKELSDALHDRGMFLMVDIVVNHVFWPGSANSTKYDTYTPFNSSKYFHKACRADNSNQTALEVCQIQEHDATDFITLPDIKTEDPAVRDLFQDWIKDLVETYNVDGLRLDTYKHVERSFWPDFLDAAGVYALAEYLDGDPANYVDSLLVSEEQGLLNYPTHYWVRRVFQDSKTWMTELIEGIGKMRNGPINTNRLAPFFECHDDQRFASLTGDLALVKNAMAFNLLFDGIPVIYQGQEQHFSGQMDPFNRERLWTSGYNEDAVLYKWIARLNAIRALVIESDSSFLSDQAEVVWSGAAPAAAANATGGANGTSHTTATSNNHMAVKKGSLVSVLTNVGVGGAKLDVELSRKATGYGRSAKYVDLVSCDVFQTDRTGALAFEMSWLPRVFFPAEDAHSAGHCPSKHAVDDDSDKCLVTFNMTTETYFGQTVQILGNVAELGFNNRYQAVTLASTFYTSDNPLWTLTIEIPAGEKLSYQYIKVDGSGVPTWDGGKRDALLKSYRVPKDCVGGEPVTVIDSWTDAGVVEAAASVPKDRAAVKRGLMRRLPRNIWDSDRLYPE